jgi:hypothetical protein
VTALDLLLSVCKAGLHATMLLLNNNCIQTFMPVLLLT